MFYNKCIKEDFLMKNRKEKKAAILLTVFGFLFLLGALLITGFLGMSDRLNGFLDAIKTYFQIWMPSEVASPLTYWCLLIFFFDICLAIAFIVMMLVKRRGYLFVTILGFGAAVAYIPFILLLTIPQVEQGSLGRMALYLLIAVTLMTMFSIVLFFLPLKGLWEAGVGVIKSMGGKEEAKPEEPREEAAPEEVVAEENGLTEEEVRAIVEEYLEAHKEELHKEGVVVAEPVEEAKEEEAPAEEAAEEAEEAEEADDEEEEEEEEVEEVQADGTVLKIKRKKRVPFENRLKRSVFDLRHKYYDLRDYIKWYGIKNRISIPGDTFTLKRKKYAFITIVGKHIKLYAAIDPSKYEDSPIPVERATAKRYEEVPCVLRVKSDLSYRRAKGIIDDVMAEAGIAKPEGPEPKETQHPEEN